MCAVVALQLGCLTWRQQCRGVLSYFSMPEVRQVLMALSIAGAILLSSSAVTGSGWLPRNVIVIDALLSILLLSGFRLLLRAWRERCQDGSEESDSAPARVAIVGAGSTGSQLARELNSSKRSSRRVVAFFDDDSQKWQKRIHEVPIVGMPECLLQGWAEKLDEIVIALPGASAARVGELRDLFREAGLRVYTVSPWVRFWDKTQDQRLAA